MDIILPNENEKYDDYINRILNCRDNVKDQSNYLERHHIIPKCIGGKNDSNNVIWLYAQEHFYAHKLLAELNPHNNKLQFAFWNMCLCRKGARKDILEKEDLSESYEEARISFSKIMHDRFLGENNPGYGKTGALNSMYNKHHTEEAKKKMSEYLSNRTESHKNKLINNHADVSGSKNPNFGKIMSDELKEKISKARMGKYKGENHPFAKKIRCIEIGEVFDSIKMAIEWCGTSAHIYDCLYGKRKSAGRHPVTNEKLHWEYID